MTFGAAVAQDVHQVVYQPAGRWLDPPPIKSVCQSVLEQDIEPLMNYLWCTNQSASVWVVEKHFLALFMYELDQDLDTNFLLSWPLKVLSTIPLIHPVTHIYTLFMQEVLTNILTHTHTNDPVDASGGTQGSVSLQRNANVESGNGPLTFRLVGDPLYHSSYNRPSKEK